VRIGKAFLSNVSLDLGVYFAGMIDEKRFVNYSIFLILYIILIFELNKLMKESLKQAMYQVCGMKILPYGTMSHSQKTRSPIQKVIS